MQTIYAMHQHKSDSIEKDEKFLFQSIESMQDLYLLMLSALIEIQTKEAEYLDLVSKKHLATKEERNPSSKFTKNQLLLMLKGSESLLEKFEARRINNWQVNDDVILYLTEAIKESDLYKEYMSKEETSFKEDKFFIADLFEKVIAPNEKLYNYLEDNKLTWLDDVPVINTMILKQIKKVHDIHEEFLVPRLYKDEDDKDFAKQLFRKTVLNEVELSEMYIDKTPNWDTDRIAEMDTIILKMAICEFLKFPSIPVNVTINEYLEIAKEYSTPKSSIFINGILDNLVKDLKKEEKLVKTGRGLL